MKAFLNASEGDITLVTITGHPPYITHYPKIYNLYIDIRRERVPKWFFVNHCCSLGLTCMLQVMSYFQQSMMRGLILHRRIYESVRLGAQKWYYKLIFHYGCVVSFSFLGYPRLRGRDGTP